MTRKKVKDTIRKLLKRRSKPTKLTETDNGILYFAEQFVYVGVDYS